MADGQIATGPTLPAASRKPMELTEVLPDRLVEGDAVGDYVIERFLGAGAMGDVYAGRHPVIGKRVAIKVLKRELASDKEASERFIREAKAVNQIDHPNVIDVFNFGQLKGDDGRLFLVMDLVDGKSLRKVLEDGPIEVGPALDILDKIADALDAAHARGVIHRDLKPDNVMISADGSKVFVLDFGIAKLFSATASGSGGSATLTGKGSWLGTPGYMAPEQWSAEGALPASDRYALGVMAYELIAGVLPFKANTLPQMMEQHFRAKVPALSERGTARRFAHRATLDPVLARAMAKNPEERFPTARAMVEALRAGSQGKKTVAPIAHKRSLTVPAVAGVSVLGLGVVGALMLRGKDDDGDTRERPNAIVPSDNVAKIAIEIVTQPDKATVSRDGVQLGQTPFKKEIDAGGKGVLTISKPGFRSITETLAFDKPINLTKDLMPILGYEGVWSMPDGKLRGFKHTAENKIEIYRLDSVTTSERELWRTCDVVAGPAGRDLVVFTTTAELTDERAHTGDVGCSIPHGIEYSFDPQAETLSVRVERIETTKKHGHCEVVSKTWREPRMLTRADRSGEIRVTEPPVGVPIKGKNKPDKVSKDSFDNAFDGGKSPRQPDDKQLKLDAQKTLDARNTVKTIAPSNTVKPVSKPPPSSVPTKKPPPSKKSPKETDFDLNAPAGNAEPPPPTEQKQAPTKGKPIQKSEVPSQAPSQPQAQAPQPPRGDSQAAK